MKVAFVVPPRSKHGFVEAEDCCFRAAKKCHLPAMLLACASQLDGAMFFDLSIDKPSVLNAAKPDVVVYPTIWNHYDWIMASMKDMAPDAYKIILPVPPGYAESQVGASGPWRSTVKERFPRPFQIALTRDIICVWPFWA